jgi:Tol biopolymer transport system component
VSTFYHARVTHNWTRKFGDGKSVPTIRILLCLAVVLSCFACGSSERQAIIDSLRASEKINGERILVSSRGIYSVDLTRSALVPVYAEGNSSNVFQGMASPSPDGGRLTFSESIDLRSYSLMTFDLRTGLRTTLVQLPYLAGPRWSPRGNSIAFEGTKTRTAGMSSLFLYKFGVAEPSLIVDDGVKNGDFLISWSPDGTSIAYQSAQDRICIVDVDSKQLRCIVSGQFPSWSPDGKYLSYRSSENEYSIYDLQANQSKSILRGDSVGRTLVWSPDSRYLVYSKLGGDFWGRVTDILSVSDSYSDLYVLDLRTHAQVRVYRHDGSLYPTAWCKIEVKP